MVETYESLMEKIVKETAKKQKNQEKIEGYYGDIDVLLEAEEVDDNHETTWGSIQMRVTTIHSSTGDSVMKRKKILMDQDKLKEEKDKL